MTNPIPKSTLLRFPIIFGGFLLLGGVGFAYRDKFMGDIEAKRKELMTENTEGRIMIENFKQEYRK